MTARDDGYPYADYTGGRERGGTMVPRGPMRGRKSKTVAVALCVALGLFGGHRYYLGRWQSGLKMAAVTALAILFTYFSSKLEFIKYIAIVIWVAAAAWVIADLVRILLDELRDANNKKLGR